MGLLELRQGIEGELSYLVRMDGKQLVINDTAPFPVDPSHRVPARWGSLTDLLRQPRWATFDESSLFLMFLRKTGIQSANGKEWYLVASVGRDSSLSALPTEALVDFRAGQIEQILDITDQSRGLQPSQVIQQPFLKVGEKRMAIRSTLHLDMIELINERNKLVRLPSPTTAESARLKWIENHPSGICSRHNETEGFYDYLRALPEKECITT